MNIIKYHNHCFKGFVAELMHFQSRSLVYLQEKVLTITWLLGGLCTMTWWPPFVPLWTNPYVIPGHTDGRILVRKPSVGCGGGTKEACVPPPHVP